MHYAGDRMFVGNIFLNDASPTRVSNVLFFYLFRLLETFNRQNWVKRVMLKSRVTI